MPTYDYKCNACSHTFEHFQSMKDKVLRTCPLCKKPALERLIGTGAAIIFKGAGFYETDYRSESYKKAADAEKTSANAAPSTQASPPAKGDADAASKPASTDSKAPGNATQEKPAHSQSQQKHTPPKPETSRGTASKPQATGRNKPKHRAKD